MQEIVLGVTDFVALLNQTLEYAYPNVVIQGELANFRISKNRWVYFDLKDEFSSVKFFGTVYQLPGPLEDGLMLQVRGQPRLHQLYGFSVIVQTIQPVGEGSLKRAAALLKAKLAGEGLFDTERKRPLPYPPAKIGLITSAQSAAYADFIKILNERWGGVEINLVDVQVQGEQAPAQIIKALEYFNTQADPAEVVVITRGGGSAEDLAAFNNEQVTRAVAASRIPTLVAIGHEIDISLAEMAADQRASTPSNAAQLLVPDKKQLISQLPGLKRQFGQLLTQSVERRKNEARERAKELREIMSRMLDEKLQSLRLKRQLLGVLDPNAALRRGYAIVRRDGKLLRSVTQVKKGERLKISLTDGEISSVVE